MRVQAKILFLLLFLAILFAIIFLINGDMQHRTLHAIMKQDERQYGIIFDKFLGFRARGAEIFVTDYTWWEEMVDFVNNYKDRQEWGKQNIDVGLSLYNVNVVWIFNTNLDLAYSVDNFKDDRLKNLPLPKDNIKKIFSGDQRYCHFFVDTPLGLEELHGRTIHHGNDPERKGEPQGYFLSGQLWDKVYLDDLSLITGSTITITPLRGNFPPTPTIDEKHGIINIYRVLYDMDNQPLVQIQARFRSEGAIILIQQSRQYLLLFGCFMAAVFALIVISIIRWTSIPLRLISMTLSSENPVYIHKLQGNNTEFGSIAKLINVFFTQKDNLIKENTERKRAEEQLEDAYKQLKQTQAQLVQSVKMASIGQLAGGVAHEINNPLTGVLNNVQLIKMMQEQKKDFNVSDFKELLDSIEESAVRCKKITQSLLDFSRISTNLFQPSSFNELAENVCGLIGREMQLENIRIQKEFQPDIPLVLGDQQLLQQVIFDIISNAKWAIQEKVEKTGGTITIKTGYEPGNKQAVLSISDTGKGIPKENIAKIFDPFFTTKAVGEGTGLGLSIAYGIVKEHKGSIEVESTLGKGTVFKIKLPVPDAKSLAPYEKEKLEDA
jgi:signal transduction histidine kinase